MSTPLPPPEPLPDDLPPNGLPQNTGADGGGPAPVGAGAFQPPREDPQAGAVPPGYDWPTHGGYLGCLFGLIISCLACGLVGAPIAELSNHGVVAAPLAILLTLVLAAAFAFGFGRLGWVLGKRFYREYPQPEGRRVWYDEEEADEAPMVAADDAATRTPGTLPDMPGSEIRPG